MAQPVETPCQSDSFPNRQTMYKERLFHKYSDEAIRRYLESDECPLSRFVGNQDAIGTLRSLAFQAWKNKNHATISSNTGKPEKINVALVGGPGLGKTTLAKLFAQTLLLPFIELSKTNEVQQIFDAISEGLKASGQELTLHNGKYIAQPNVLFIDEVHRFCSQARKAPKGIMNDLLKATEPDDARLVKQGSWHLDCTNICFTVATTEWYLLPKPFRERFEKIELLPYTDDECTAIVMSRFPSIPREAAALAAFYGRNIPRVAISYCKIFNLERDYKKLSWIDAAESVAQKKGIDEFGMDRDGLSVLMILAKNEYLSTDKLANYCGKNEIELLEMVLPALVTPPKAEPFIRHTRRGWMLLPAGIDEVKKRKVA